MNLFFKREGFRWREQSWLLVSPSFAHWFNNGMYLFDIMLRLLESLCEDLLTNFSNRKGERKEVLGWCKISNEIFDQSDNWKKKLSLSTRIRTGAHPMSSKQLLSKIKMRQEFRDAQDNRTIHCILFVRIYRYFKFLNYWLKFSKSYQNKSLLYHQSYQKKIMFCFL